MSQLRLRKEMLPIASRTPQTDSPQIMPHGRDGFRIRPLGIENDVPFQRFDDGGAVS